VLQEWISLADVYPSILDLAGSDLAESSVHGRSFAPLLRAEPVAWRDTMFVEFNGVNSLATSMITVRKDNWKYGWNCSNTDELYDLAADPHETENLIDDPGCLAQVIEMRDTLEAWMVETSYPGRRMYVQSRMQRQPWL
jgi:arylsulfatase A-like enzyme